MTSRKSAICSGLTRTVTCRISMNTPHRLAGIVHRRVKARRKSGRNDVVALEEKLGPLLSRAEAQWMSGSSGRALLDLAAHLLFHVGHLRGRAALLHDVGVYVPGLVHGLPVLPLGRVARSC